MKRIAMFLISVAAFAAVASAEDRPVTFDQLPAEAKAYILTNFSEEQISFATKDDDILLPDYTVMLMNGTKIEFSHCGNLKSVSSKNGISSDLIPAPIREYVSAHYPEAGYLEYEVNRRSFEVKLNNRMELKFNTNFHIIELDY